MDIIPSPLFSRGEGAVETGNGVANEKAYTLGSAVLVAASGAFVAVLRNHAEIVRAHADRESPKPPACSFSVRLIRSAAVVMSLSVEDGARTMVLKG